jgi:hypothetical protein
MSADLFRLHAPDPPAGWTDLHAQAAAGAPTDGPARVVADAEPGAAPRAEQFARLTRGGSGLPAAVAGAVLYPEVDGWPKTRLVDEIAARGLPLFVRVAGAATLRQVERRLVRPGGPIVVSHAGVLGCDAALVHAAVRLAEARPSVWLCTSLLGLAGFVPFAAERVSDRLVFGSTWPAVHPRTAWAHLTCALTGASPDLLAGIGAGHAQRLLNLSPSAS